MPNGVHTGDVPERERFDFWRDEVSKTFVPLHASRRGDGSFYGRMRGASLGALRLFEVDADEHVVRRTAKLIGGSESDYFKVGLLVDGESLLVQDGREAHLSPGDFAIYDTTRPYTFAFDDAFRMLVLIFPRHLLGLPPKRIAAVTATTFSGQHGIGALVGSFLVQAAGVLGEVNPRDHPRLARNVLDLLTTALAGQLDLRPDDPDSAHRALLIQAMAYIESNLRDPHLGPGPVAAAHHISTRYLHKLFHGEGTTVSGWIRQRRLEHCGHDLRDPAYADRSVSAIAASWGLPDAAHFSRLFRAEFGVSPRDYRFGTVSPGPGHTSGQ